MTISSLTAVPTIAERSEATPGLWNNILGVIERNQNQLKSDVSSYANVYTVDPFTAAGIRAACVTANAAGGGVVQLPAGTCSLGTTVDMSSMRSVTVRGTGLATVLSVTSLGGFVLTNSVDCALEDMKFTGTDTASGLLGVVTALGATRPKIRRSFFTGGGHQIYMNNCVGIDIDDTTHGVPSVAASQNITAYQCTGGHITRPILLSGAHVTSGTDLRCIHVHESTQIILDGASARSVDLSRAPSSGIFAFSGSSHCAMVAPTVQYCKSASGIVLESSGGIKSSDILIVAPDSCYNGSAQGLGGNDQTGDGLDIFLADRVRVVNPILRGNGHYTNSLATTEGPHAGLEIYQCNDVQVTGGEVENSGNFNVIIHESANVTLNGLAVRNGARAGIVIQASGGTESTNFKLLGCDITNSGNSRSGNVGEVEGIYVAAASTGIIANCRITDSRGTTNKTQVYGIRFANTSRALIDGCVISGNSTGDVFDEVGASDIVLDTGATNISGDRGDASVTLSVGVDSKIQRFATTLTSNRTVTLSTISAYRGAEFEVVRTGLGAFTLSVGSVVKMIPSGTAASARVGYNGSAWVLLSYGAL